MEHSNNSQPPVDTENTAMAFHEEQQNSRKKFVHRQHTKQSNGTPYGAKV